MYFLADESTALTLLRRFHAAVSASGRGGPLWGATTLPDWATALALLVQGAVADQRRLVLVLDEFQYLLAADPAIPSVLQRIWDEYRRRAPLHLILCGSALGTLGRLGESGQRLHGRFDLRVRLRPFGYREAAEFTPGWSRDDRFRLYGVFGGLARHLAEVDPERSLAESATRAIVDPLGPLHEAPLDLLRTEHLSAPADANAVLSAISAGENRFTQVASRTGLTSPRVDYVLRELGDLEVVRREVRFGGRPGSRYVRHRCTDPFTLFWFRHVQPNRGALLGISPARLWAERIEPRVADHMGPVFESIVRQAIEGGALGDAWGVTDEVAPWWSRDGGHEIDLVVRSGSGLLFVECEWRAGGHVDVADLRRLREHVAASPLGKGEHRLCLATAGEFTPRLTRVAAEEDVLLLGPEGLLP